MYDEHTSTHLLTNAKNTEDSARIMNSLVQYLCSRIEGLEQQSPNNTKAILTDGAALRVAWQRLYDELGEIIENLHYASELAAQGSFGELMYLLRSSNQAIQQTSET